MLTADGSVEYETATTVTMPDGQSDIRVAARDLEPNDPLPADALTVLRAPIAGIAAVTNPAPTVLSSADESDVELRERAKTILHGSERATLGALLAAIARQGLRAELTEPYDASGAATDVPLGTVRLAPHADALPPDQYQRLLAAANDARPAGIRVTIAGTTRPARLDLELRLQTQDGLPAEDLRAAQAAVRTGVERYVGGLQAGDDVSVNRLVGIALAVAGVVDVRLVSATVTPPDGPPQDALDRARGIVALVGSTVSLGTVVVAESGAARAAGRHGHRRRRRGAARQGGDPARPGGRGRRGQRRQRTRAGRRRPAAGDHLRGARDRGRRADGRGAALRDQRPERRGDDPRRARRALSPDAVRAGVARQRHDRGGGLMAAFEQLRERLPSIYRPEHDDLGDERLPLSSGALLEVVTDPETSATWAPSHGLLLVALDAPARLRALRLASGTAPGEVHALALYPLADGVPVAPPAAVAPVRADRAEVGDLFAFQEFAVELRLRAPLTAYLLGLAAVLDQVDLDAAGVLQAHWLPTADRALLDPFSLRALELQSAPRPAADDAAVRRFPYVRDLARLASLLAIPPWRETLPTEGVEDYRLRIARIVELYALGLGTVPAIRRMVEAQLPPDDDAPPERRDRGFSIEESPWHDKTGLDVQQFGEQAELVGPLMHWEVTSAGQEATPPTIIIEGQAADADTAATVDPLIELYAVDSTIHGVGLAYRGKVPAGAALRLQPAYSSFLARANGVARADSASDPSAPGPWNATPGGAAAPGDTLALLQTPELAVWALAADGTLRRFDGTAWTTVVDSLQKPAALAASADGRVLVGHGGGLLAVPRDGGAPAPVDGVSGPVLALARAGAVLLAGTDAGVLRLQQGAAPAPFGLGATAQTQTPVRAIHEDAQGVLHFGTDLGVFMYDPALDAWYWLAGGDASDQAQDWRPFDPAVPSGFPAAADVFLPAVHAVHRDAAGTLWLGTAAGLARYVAEPGRGGAFTTQLEAFPDLGAVPVRAIAADPRGDVWFATDRGVLRFDGRDLWQGRAGGWVQLGRADARYAPEPRPRGAHRYARASFAWERFDPDTRAWGVEAPAARTTAETAVRTILWTDSVVGELLHGFDAATGGFDSAEPVLPAKLAVRWKPRVTEVRDGGVPALPRLPPGTSTWRYLALEAAGAGSAARPSWTSEGRLLPAPGGDERLYPEPGRYAVDGGDPHPFEHASTFDAAVFAYAPAARVHVRWGGRMPLTVLVRLRTRTAGEAIEPVVLDRVWLGIEQVRPAGVRALLAVNDTIVRGEAR